MKRTEQLEGYAQVLRGLINYHKRMMLTGPCYVKGEDGNHEICRTAESNNGECPKANVLNDAYLGALEESLRLIEKEIVKSGDTHDKGA